MSESEADETMQIVSAKFPSSSVTSRPRAVPYIDANDVLLRNLANTRSTLGTNSSAYADTLQTVGEQLQTMLQHSGTSMTASMQQAKAALDEREQRDRREQQQQRVTFGNLALRPKRS